MENFKKQYRDLEMRVLHELRMKVEQSEYESKHIQRAVLKVHVFDYEELAIIGDSLTFIDHDGLHYDVFSECNLEDLIDILKEEDIDHTYTGWTAKGFVESYIQWLEADPEDLSQVALPDKGEAQELLNQLNQK